MNLADWPKIEGWFHDAVGLSSPVREAFLDRICPPGNPLRAELDSLLARDSLTRPAAREMTEMLRAWHVKRA